MNPIESCAVGIPQGEKLQVGKWCMEISGDMCIRLMTPPLSVSSLLIKWKRKTSKMLVFCLFGAITLFALAIEFILNRNLRVKYPIG